MRKKFVFNKDTRAFEEVSEEFKERDRFHNVIPDSMDPLQHPANSQMYDSKKEFRKVTKRYGYEEIGNEKQKNEGPFYSNISESDYVAAATQAWEQCQSGTAPLNEYEREVCKRTDERLKNR